MKNIWLTIPFLGGLVLGLSACLPAANDRQAAAAVSEPVQLAVEATEIKPVYCAAGAGHVFQNESGDYCLVYPENFCWYPGQVSTVNSFVSRASDQPLSNRCPEEPLLFHGEVVWLTIQVEPANRQPLEAWVTGFTAGLEDFGLAIEEVEIAGETAVQINNMPGQDISRELLTRHNDHFYRLTFVPASADYDERYAQMEALYELVIDTFHFLP